jgi:hypothetical protein
MHVGEQLTGPMQAAIHVDLAIIVEIVLYTMYTEHSVSLYFEILSRLWTSLSAGI